MSGSMKKVLEYLANGAAEVWLIYPDQRNALVYDASGGVRNETVASTFLWPISWAEPYPFNVQPERYCRLR
jgi:hypothetical protein